jgi:hypothetical protein
MDDGATDRVPNKTGTDTAGRMAAYCQPEGDRVLPATMHNVDR